MSRLQKATLQEIGSDRDAQPVGDPVEVQFNPETLRLSLRNQVEGGQNRGRQVRQYTGSSSTSLSFDLVFDTADEIRADGTARSVRERTAMVERFVLPRGEGEDKQSPPRVRFHWGNLVVDGIIGNLDVDFELFSPDGVPLRAKMRVTVQEQDPKYEYLEAGPGANQPPAGAAAPAEGAGAAGQTGTRGSGRPDRSVAALAGESAAALAARAGLDPSRWRALTGLPDDPLSLPAGAELSFAAGAGGSAGLGVRSGASAGAGASLESSLGLAAGADARTSGLALAAAGGVSAALDTVAVTRAQEAQGAARSAFGVGGASASASASAGAGAGRAEASASASASASAGVRPDPRATSYGQGVPLRPRASIAADARADLSGGAADLTPREEGSGASPSPSSPSWSAGRPEGGTP